MARKKSIAPDTETIIEDAKTLKDDTVQYLKQKATEGKIEAKIKKQELKENLSETMDSMSEASKEQIARAEDTVRKKPLQSVAAAFATGALLSFLLKRR